MELAGLEPATSWVRSTQEVEWQPRENLVISSVYCRDACSRL